MPSLSEMGEHPNDAVTAIAPQSGSVHGRLLAGDLLADRFLVVRYVAAGGMGEVYEVEDRQLQGVHLALKTILPHIAANPEMRLRFEREVLLTRRVSHPSLCPIYDMRTTRHNGSELMFLTMKLLAGETLATRLKRSGAMTVVDAAPIVAQVGAALTAAHDAGILHRDIKTANIMLQGEGQNVHAVVMDFGLARTTISEDSATTLTVEGVAGTLGYLAPELLHGAPASKASDVFAFGVVVYKMLTGQVPTAALDLKAKLARDPALAKLPADWQRLLLGCLETSPAKRFQDMPEALASLQGARRKLSSGLGAFSRRKMLALLGGAAAGVGVGAWFEGPQIENWMHPLPAKRFAAVVNWPPSSDAKIAPMITAVVDAIGNELARAEASDRNLFVISKHLGSEIKSLSQLNNIRESLGANLVLSAFAAQIGNDLEFILRVMDSASSITLRSQTIRIAFREQLFLVEKAVRSAAMLLGVKHYKTDDQHSQAGTLNPGAYAAFQTAEALRDQENDTGLDGAVTKYREAIELDPRYGLASARLAMAYFRSFALHRDPAAIELARENSQNALAIDPNLVEAHLALASVLDRTGDKSGAQREFLKALSIDPGNPRALLYQGQALTRANEWHSAEETFSRLVGARPNYWLAHQEFGIALSAQGKYEKAVIQFRAASLAAPKRSLPLANLSMAYLQLGRQTDAIEAARKALTLGQDDAAASFMAAALRTQGKYDEAVKFAQKAVEFNPDYPSNWLELSDSYSGASNGKDKEKTALSRLQKLQQDELKTDPTDGPNWMLLSLAQAKLGDFAGSKASLAHADALNTKDLDSQLMRARILELLNQREDAIKTLITCSNLGASSFQLKTMPDISALQSDIRYLNLVSQIERQ